MAADGSPMLFDGCRIAFVPSRSLSMATIAEASNIVTKYGGEVLEPEDDGRVAIHEATHIIANTIDFEEYEQVHDRMVPVVASSWIGHSLHKKKLAVLRPHSPDPRFIFHSVNVTCADIPPSDKESIIGATLALGGSESKDLTRLTTHICALTLDHPKCVQALAKKHKCKIVLPHWFDDCFKLGKKIDESPYLLPDPEILKTDMDARRVGMLFPQHLEGASSNIPSTTPEEPKGRSLTVFGHKKVMLGGDLPVSDRFLEILRGTIDRGGGKLVDNVNECDMFVCHYRDGEDYVRASQKGISVGNLSWLLYMITLDQWSSPLGKLLHYPIPRNGIPGFEGLKITVSNYAGEARAYLENLVKACGAEYTKTMKQDNTHLITARANSEKCEAALDWNVTMVNHLWIEESYAKCELLKPTRTPSYTHFPPRTDLSEVIGQTRFQEHTLRELYYPGGDVQDSEAAPTDSDEPMPDAETSVPPGDGEQLESEDDDTDAGRESSTAAEPRSSQTAAGKKAGAKTPKAPPLKKAAANKAAFATPARPSRHAGVGKENETPTPRPSTGRSAKDKALNKLHGLAPDIALYEKEKKRTKDNQTPFGGKRALTALEKRKAEAEAAEKEKEDVQDDSERPTKRARPSQPPVQYRIMITGWTRWIDTGDKTKGGALQEDKERRKLRQMGIQIVQEGQPCDYLAAPKVVRTQKFLTTLARGPDLINVDFLTQALETGELPNIEEYALKDPTHPEILKFVARARQNKGKLLWGVPVYCTAEVPHGPSAFKAIAEANGAIFKVYRARSGSTIRPTTAEEDGGAPPDPVYLVSGESAAEKQLWAKFSEMARQGHMEPRVVGPDWLLDVAMRQKLDFQEGHLLM
ncbi:BRCT domain-containing protein [Gaeumannomyces tritici R3-111a-1]|uniref:BRCT domain-containing protein n=1 Tax=Gaeumannomyces tritici (strain R3-111a-1) TaxID=644352 RepID=J3P060_GAET3|nr:BRCT domain-containing protein [Gaeumannomyces tritici R3-111a-1]EJT76993.1 BRCT domain-containing protein [Gaeumannomyces tritici R3-111a-1]